MSNKSLTEELLRAWLIFGILYTFPYLILGLVLFIPLLLLMFYSPFLAILSLLTVILPVFDNFLKNEEGEDFISSSVTGGLMMAFCGSDTSCLP
ncbi:hypothetical protein AOA81_06090 [Methanomassiliicoccales archaeon RumEn M2]|nr:hypothetical protein AOA81_06090 [Methanomassiliicoccales archaeon RumEn M2]